MATWVQALHIVQFINWYPVLTPYQAGLGWMTVGADASGPLPGDPIFTETAAYDLTITTNPNITIVSGGLVSSNNGQWRFAFKNARTVAFIAGDDFDFLTQLEGGTAITSYYLKEHAEAGKAALTTAAQALSLFNDRFGAYPYPTLAVAEDCLRGLGHGQRGGASYRAGYADYAGKPDSLLVATLPQALARLWWGQIVQGDSFNQPWLNEALPMYSEYLFIESVLSRFEDLVLGLRINYWKPEGLLGRPVSDFSDDEDYLRNLLRRGALFMDGLRKNIGDDAFFAVNSASNGSIDRTSVMAAQGIKESASNPVSPIAIVVIDERKESVIANVLRRPSINSAPRLNRLRK